MNQILFNLPGQFDGVFQSFEFTHSRGNALKSADRRFLGAIIVYQVRQVDRPVAIAADELIHNRTGPGQSLVETINILRGILAERQALDGGLKFPGHVEKGQIFRGELFFTERLHGSMHAGYFQKLRRGFGQFRCRLESFGELGRHIDFQLAAGLVVYRSRESGRNLGGYFALDPILDPIETCSEFGAGCELGNFFGISDSPVGLPAYVA